MSELTRSVRSRSARVFPVSSRPSASAGDQGRRSSRFDTMASAARPQDGCQPEESVAEPSGVKSV
ncbi:hypothetical protein AB0D54_14480 [Streptomyces xanthophaeus]|uniref:hypothetical protein n=1 Tax=Streptomyces xanthophaeus TaxID=67385 RepID=UPI00341ECA1E